jgi:hypothetical protein
MHRHDNVLSYKDADLESGVLAADQAADFAERLSAFAPSLIPGQTRIVLADYQDFLSYPIAVLMDAIRAGVALESVVVGADDDPQANTASFVVTDPIDMGSLNEVVRSFTSWPAERIRATWSRIMAPWPDHARKRLAPGLALFLYDAGHEDEALVVLAETPMDPPMLKRWERLGDLSHPSAGIAFFQRYPRLFVLMRETRLDATRAISNAQRRESLLRAMSMGRDAEPKLHLAAWKQVLAENSIYSNAAKRAAKRVVNFARELGDPSELVDGLIALLHTTPNDAAARQRLVRAATSPRQAQKALDVLARHARADLTGPEIEALHERVCLACHEALRAGDTDLALSLFQSLERVNDKHPRLEALRPALGRTVASR